MKISVIITNWNGVSLLKKNLEAVIKLSPEADEIIIADDASTDDSKNYIKTIKKKYKHLKLLTHKHNVGFGLNTNYAVKKSTGDLVVLLNNDIYPHPDYIKNALRHFKENNVFGVGFAEEGHENFALIYWSDGYLQHKPGFSNKTHITAWLSGGSSIVRRDLFLRLGGFDRVYAPFYSEDLDLGYRAWKSGYLLLWEPRCVVKHHHESTISKFPKHFSDYVKERNRLLTVWRNVTDNSLLFKNRLAIISRIFFGPNYIKIIRAANRQIKNFPPPIIYPKLTDNQLLEKFRNDI